MYIYIYELRVIGNITIVGEFFSYSRFSLTGYEIKALLGQRSVTDELLSGFGEGVAVTGLTFPEVGT